MKNLSLLTYISNILDDSELNEFDQELRKICINKKLPSAFNSRCHEVKYLDWWIKVSTRYPNLFNIVTAIISFFHRPRFERRLSEMKDVIQMVKYSLLQKVIDSSYSFTFTCILHVVNIPNFRVIQRK